MRLMRRVRDGKIAVYEPTCVATGRWEEVFEKKPEPQKPRAPRPPKPVVKRTEAAQVMALFRPPTVAVQNEAQKEPA